MHQRQRLQTTGLARALGKTDGLTDVLLCTADISHLSRLSLSLLT